MSAYQVSGNLLNILKLELIKKCAAYGKREIHAIMLQKQLRKSTETEEEHPDTLLITEQPAPQSLPSFVSSFIGREQEILELKQVLTSHRLVTLTGSGGCGKTRLALEVAAQMGNHFSDGIWLTELAALTDPDLVPQSILSTFGLREQPGRTVIETLIHALGSKQLLLVLDNCEHLVDACAELVSRLLRSCSQLHMIATSRESLHIDGEAVWLVPPLALPDPQRLTKPEKLVHYDALRLFIDRTTNVQPTFRLTEHNTCMVATLCRRLDGIPLALEMAAAWMNVLSLEQIIARLDHSFHLLSNGSRMALPRQQTLQATIDWSYALLSEKERLLLCRLSVFAGGWTLSAAEEVCGGEFITEHVMLEVLSGLVNKSLVVVTEAGVETRYRLLETIRQYAWEQLVSTDEVGTIRRRHADFFTRLADSAEPHLKSASRREWLATLSQELDNVRAALKWSSECGETGLGMHLAGALLWFWYFQGFLSEGCQWFKGLLAASSQCQHTLPYADALYGLGTLTWMLGDYAGAYRHLSHSMVLFRQLQDKPSLAYALTLLGLVVALQGDHAAACALQEESVVLFREVNLPWGLALALYWHGECKRRQHDPVGAHAFFTESLTLFRGEGDRWGLSLPLQGLGALAYRQGKYALACSQFEEALALRREMGDTWLIAQSLNSLGLGLQQLNDYQQAQSHLEESVALYRELGDTSGLSTALGNLGQSLLSQKHYQQAEELFRERLVLSRDLGHRRHLLESFKGLACLAEARGQMLRAQHLSRAADMVLDTQTNPSRQEHLPVLGAHGGERALTLEQAIDYALTETQETTLIQVSEELVQPLTLQTISVEAQSSPALRICALGSTQVYRGGKALTSSDWTYAKVKELLFYLLCHHTRTKEQIGLIFWPDASAAGLRNSFHVSIHHLRQALGHPDWILCEQQRYAFNRRLPYWFDVESFESHLAQAQQMTRVAPAQAQMHLQEAVKLYQGDFLDDLGMGDWYLERRDALQRMYRDALLTLGRLQRTEGSYAQAAATYRQVLAHDNYLEAAHRELMCCYVQQGERGQALRHYQSLLEWTRDELGTDPAPETTALFHRLRRGLEC